MTKPQILSEEPMAMVDIKQHLASIRKKDKELNFRANKTEEYMNQFVEITPKQAKEIKAKITKLKIPRLKEFHIIKILDTLPSSAQQLKTILQGYTLTITLENLKKITDITKDYLPEQK